MDAAKGAASKIAEGEKEIGRRLTVLWHELQPWQQDNHYIHSGYRPVSNSYAKSIKSLRYIHNETVNVYSHLIGATLSIVCYAIAYTVFRPRYQAATIEDVFVFSCFFLGAAACLGMSATYHLISNHSQDVSHFANKLDYLGIVVLIWGSFIPCIYYGFQSKPQLIYRYWTMITTIGVCTATACIHPKMRSPALRPFRALMFVLMGLSACAPVAHGLELFGIEELRNVLGLDWVLLQGALYILGAGIYAARVPERLRPGKFDIWGSSHQIFHVLIVIAAVAHLCGLVKAFDYAHGQRKGLVYLTFLHKLKAN
ncbi:HlyIII-domain-containing protein [Aaosphaeria arxii CBS 175.79]|uniref:HlyIII-domain-containing protein n=1 Tax=Aaosphaeria arxii CBS 175.79 TaxID=1450172 RepID=A0A6A5Y9Q2_9PLEO|nr:HlyIII-domain-containing protein [Aaosphaeria arxii CBS 175.79]KAF2021540.1 HlyIII-domain-containing protein [Aaosphaeria arxii CBS 175.79]